MGQSANAMDVSLRAIKLSHNDLPLWLRENLTDYYCNCMPKTIEDSYEETNFAMRTNLRRFFRESSGELAMANNESNAVSDEPNRFCVHIFRTVKDDYNNGKVDLLKDCKLNFI